MFNRKDRIENMDAYVEERLSDYLDGTLSPHDRAIVETHLEASERARASLESLRYTVQLLKQTPAPALPRQFTLPVTSRAPTQGAPSWLTWSLRGVAVAATAAFVILLTATLLRQEDPNQAANAPVAAVVPSVVVAMNAQPTRALEGALQESANDTSATQVMITVEAPAAVESAPITIEPSAAQKSQQAQTSEADAVPPPASPTEAPVANSQVVQPTSAAPASASGASGNAPELGTNAATPSVDASTQRSTFSEALTGQIIISQLKVREGPGTEYRAIGGVRRGETVTILGRSKESLWLLIEFPRNRKTGQGWISVAYVELNAALETAPFADFIDVDQPAVIIPPTETAAPPLETETPSAPTATPDPNGATPVPNEEPTKESNGNPTTQAPEGNATETPTP